MKACNVIVLFHWEHPKLLMCRRLHQPYQGKFNLGNKKVEPFVLEAKNLFREE